MSQPFCFSDSHLRTGKWLFFQLLPLGGYDVVPQGHFQSFFDVFACCFHFAERVTKAVSLLDPGQCRPSRAAFGQDSEPFLGALIAHDHVTVNLVENHKEPTTLHCDTQRRADGYGQLSFSQWPYFGQAKAACNGQMKHAQQIVRYVVKPLLEKKWLFSAKRIRRGTCLSFPVLFRRFRVLCPLLQSLWNLVFDFPQSWAAVQPVSLRSFVNSIGISSRPTSHLRPATVIQSFLHPSSFHNQLPHHIAVLICPWTVGLPS